MPDFPDNNKAKPMVSPAAMPNYPCGIPMPSSMMPSSMMPASFGDPTAMPWGFDGGFDGMMSFGDPGDFGDPDPFGRRRIFHHHVHVHHHFHHFPMGGRPFGF